MQSWIQLSGDQPLSAFYTGAYPVCYRGSAAALKQGSRSCFALRNDLGFHLSVKEGCSKYIHDVIAAYLTMTCCHVVACFYTKYGYYRQYFNMPLKSMLRLFIPLRCPLHLGKHRLRACRCLSAQSIFNRCFRLKLRVCRCCQLQSNNEVSSLSHFRCWW